VNSRNEITGVEDNSILNKGVEDRNRNVVGTALFDINNLDSTLFRATINKELVKKGIIVLSVEYSAARYSVCTDV
jgi:hypothetical protein